MTYDKSPIGQKRKRVASFELFSIGLVGSAKPRSRNKGKVGCALFGYNPTVRLIIWTTFDEFCRFANAK